MTATSSASPSENEATGLEFHASRAISRLEEALDRGTETEGAGWNNSGGFLSQPKSLENIFSLMQVEIIRPLFSASF